MLGPWNSLTDCCPVADCSGGGGGCRGGRRLRAGAAVCLTQVQLYSTFARSLPVTLLLTSAGTFL